MKQKITSYIFKPYMLYKQKPYVPINPYASHPIHMHHHFILYVSFISYMHYNLKLYASCHNPYALNLIHMHLHLIFICLLNNPYALPPKAICILSEAICHKKKQGSASLHSLVPTYMKEDSK